MTFLCLSDLDLKHKRVVIRVDANVPMKDGVVQNDRRLRAILPTLQRALDAHARVILLSHLGRPVEGQYNAEFSLKPIAEYLSKLLDQPVRFVQDWVGGVEVAPKEVVLCENVRFNRGEKLNDESLSRRLASLCDVFVMDAFASAHRAEASTVGIAKYAPLAAAGPLLVAELSALRLILQAPKRPLVALVGGAKVSDKLPLLQSLLKKVDVLLLGGGIANTFIAALGYAVGSSLYEPSLVPTARALMELAKECNVQLLVPIDVVVARELSNSAPVRVANTGDIQADEKIFDVGQKTAAQYAAVLKSAGTILWNGPVGVFEWTAFSAGTEQVANAIANSGAFSVAGGGETVSAIDHYGIQDKMSYISTGGGAFLEYLEGKTLPAVAILEAQTAIYLYKDSIT